MVKEYYQNSLIISENSIRKGYTLSIFPNETIPRVSYQGCPSTEASLIHRFGFNFSEDINENTWNFFDSSEQGSVGDLRGRIIVDRGDFLQESDLEVRAIVQTKNEIEKAVQFRLSNSTLYMDYDSINNTNSCTEVEIYLFLRPWPIRSLDRFEINTSSFAILVKPSLGWTVNNLIAHSAFGDLTMESGLSSVDPLIAQNVSFTTINGTIFGWFTPDKNLRLHNDAGNTGIFLCGRLEPFIFHPRSISISSLSGYIDLRFVDDSWPIQVYSHRTTVETSSGGLSAFVPHGSFTNITSLTGNISAGIQSYGALHADDNSELYTNSPIGNTLLYIYGSPKSLIKKYFNPLNNTHSIHILGNGDSFIRYPYSWWGEMEAEAKNGEINFDGSRIEYFDREDGFIIAKRGYNGRSRMRAYTETGNLKVHLGL